MVKHDAVKRLKSEIMEPNLLQDLGHRDLSKGGAPGSQGGVSQQNSLQNRCNADESQVYHSMTICNRFSKLQILKEGESAGIAMNSPAELSSSLSWIEITRASNSISGSSNPSWVGIVRDTLVGATVASDTSGVPQNCEE